MDLQTFFVEFLAFLNSAIIPFLLAIAFVVFIWNVVRYFIIGGQNEQDQEKARSYAMWGILAFVVILSFWGIVNLIIGDLGFGGDVDQIIPDYMKEKGADSVSPCINDPFAEGCNPVGDPCDTAPDPDACRNQYNNAG